MRQTGDRNMIPYNHKLKLIQKALSNPTIKVTAIAKEGNVSYSSLKQWLSAYKKDTFSLEEQVNQRRPKDWTRSERLQTVLECSSLSPEDLGSYCREHGIYAEQVTEWRASIVAEQPEKTLRDHLRIQKQLKDEISVFVKVVVA